MCVCSNRKNKSEAHFFLFCYKKYIVDLFKKRKEKEFDRPFPMIVIEENLFILLLVVVTVNTTISNAKERVKKNDVKRALELNSTNLRQDGV